MLRAASCGEELPEAALDEGDCFMSRARKSEVISRDDCSERTDVVWRARVAVRSAARGRTMMDMWLRVGSRWQQQVLEGFDF